MSRSRKITQKDIADQLGLTIHTVSKALRGLGGMSETTRQDIYKTAQSLGYRLKEQELSLAIEKIPVLSAKKYRLAMLLAEETPFFRLQLQGIQERLEDWGHTVTTVLLPSNLNGESGTLAWLERIGLQYYDGLILSPALPSDLETLLLGMSIPKVLINYPPPRAKVDSVVWDMEGAVHQAVHHLRENGHRRILYVGYLGRHRGFFIRWRSFQEAHLSMGLPAIEPSEHALLEQGTDDWVGAITGKLRSGDFSAILCANNLNPAWLYYAVQSIGKRIPEDYSLVTLEYHPNELMPDPSRPVLLIKEAGRRAAERLLWRIANPNEPCEHIRLQGGYVEGSTVRRVREAKD